MSWNVRREQRGSDSHFVAAITHVAYDSDTADVTTPDGLWDIVVQKHAGKIAVLQTGVISRPVALNYDEGDEYLSISFKPGVYMPRLSGRQMLDEGVFRRTTSNRAFELDGEVLEIPTFDNAEGLVERLVRKGIVAHDDIVAATAAGWNAPASPRSLQRHFVRVLGLTPTQLRQIQRARQAVDLLQQGRPPVEVAAELGYADQPHMTRSLRRFMGRTPGEIARPIVSSDHTR